MGPAKWFPKIRDHLKLRHFVKSYKMLQAILFPFIPFQVSGKNHINMNNTHGPRLTLHENLIILNKMFLPICCFLFLMQPDSD